MNFPTVAPAPISPIPPTLTDMVEAEGRSAGASVSFPVTQVVSGTNIISNADGTTTFLLTNAGIASPTTSIGDILFPKGMVISCADKIEGYYSTNINYLNDSQFPALIYGTGNFVAGGGAGNFLIPLSGNMKHRAQIVGGGFTKITKPFTTTLTSYTVNFTYNITVGGTIVSGDINYSAPYVIDLWGDSILKGTGPTIDANTIETFIRNYYAAKGYNVRTRNKSIGGSTSTQHVYVAKNGDYRIGRKPAVVFIGLGTNPDVSTAQSVSNIITLVNEALALTPTTKVIVIPPPPRNNTVFESGNAALFTATQTALSTLNNSRIYYATGVRTAWPATDSSYYITESPQTHPNETKGVPAYTAALQTTLDLAGGLTLIPYY